jgi:hypothetical protein
VVVDLLGYDPHVINSEGTFRISQIDRRVKEEKGFYTEVERGTQR